MCCRKLVRLLVDSSPANQAAPLGIEKLEVEPVLKGLRRRPLLFRKGLPRLFPPKFLMLRQNEKNRHGLYRYSMIQYDILMYIQLQTRAEGQDTGRVRLTLLCKRYVRNSQARIPPLSFQTQDRIAPFTNNGVL